MRHMVDLCAGLGGASEAMIQDPNWNVLRIDNNPLLIDVPGMVLMDVKTVRGRVRQYWDTSIDLIWCSPPCTEFSGGFNSPKSKAARSPEGLDSYEPNLDILMDCLEIIKIVQPKYWVIENVVGSIRYFAEILGEPRQIIGPYVLWGNFPYLDVDLSKITKKTEKSSSPHPLRSNRRALVCYEVSYALKKSIEFQHSIFDY